MPAIVIINDEGNLNFQNITQNIAELMRNIRKGDQLPGTAETPPQERLDGLVILPPSPPVPTRKAPALSERQILVLRLLARALTPEQIALKLGLSEGTIRMHMCAIKRKFKTDSRDQMMAMAGSLGLCDPFGTETHSGLE